MYMVQNCIISYWVLWNVISQLFVGVFEEFKKHCLGCMVNYIMTTLNNNSGFGDDFCRGILDVNDRYTDLDTDTSY